MPSHAPLFRYLRDCYRDDHRSGSLLDVFASGVEERIVAPEGLEVLTIPDATESVDPSQEGSYDDFAPFRYQQQRKLAQRAWLGRGERELLLGMFFIVGRIGGRTGRQICAPLWTWEHVRRGEDGVEHSQGGLNVPLLRLLVEWRHGVVTTNHSSRDSSEALDDESTPAEDWPEEVRDDLESELDSILSRLTAVPRNSKDLETASAILDETLNVRALAEEAANGATLRRLRRSRTRPVSVHCEMQLLRRRGIDSRGVLTELSRLAEEDSLSDSLHCLVHDSRMSSRMKRDARRIEASAVLSAPQQTVILNAETEPLSLVVGPPGTGKSFTIAAAILDALTLGESVLVVAKTNHAVDVVANKLEDLLGLGEWVVRGGRREYKRLLADRLDRWLEGNLPLFGQDRSEIRRLESELDQLERKIKVLERHLGERSELEIEWGDFEAGLGSEVGGGFLASLWSRWRHARRRAELDGSLPYWQLMDSYREAMEGRIHLISELLRHRVVARLRGALSKHRPTLSRLRRSVTARSVSLREGHFADLDQHAMLRAAPVWMVRAPDAAQVLPLQRQLFDLVIFDEATQCDMASALPAMQRARRCQVVGDPRQLRHLSFLSRRHQRRLAERHGLTREQTRRFDYRDQSLLDLVNQTLATQAQVAFLDEHFRSVPEIIEFSNREFYAGRLRIMQEHPAQHFHRALELRRVDGRREESGVNRVELAALVEEVEAYVRAQAYEPDELVHSLGVLSPLRAQVDALTEALTERLTAPELARHDLRVATAYGFQGEERDVMFLSLVVDAASHPSALRYLQRPDVFNVAITRARVRQIVYTSLAQDEVPEGLLSRYVMHVERGGDPPSASRAEPDDDFLREVRSRLELEGMRVWPEYSIAGMTVDLVAEKGGRCLGIDLIGYPGRFAGSFELERYRIFNRAGLRLMPLPYSAWRADGVGCVRAVLERLTS
ncbi:MAG: AAA domain-containing protein [Thermoanaerobaculia bacterium]|nr:AAA domain-containing protein [Thermoanaerobaculia bacterium]